MKAAIYCRVSTENQKVEGTSLDTQLEACLKLAKERGYEVDESHVIEEVYSGLTADRPYLNKLRGWLDSGEIQAVVIHVGDRFMRDGYDLVGLKRHCDKCGVELLCVTNQLDNELVVYMLGWAARQEAEKIRERCLRGLKERARSGKLVGVGLFIYSDFLMLRGSGFSIISKPRLCEICLIGLMVVRQSTPLCIA